MHTASHNVGVHLIRLSIYPFFYLQAYGIVSLLFVVASILGFCLETLPDLRPVNITLKDVHIGCDGTNVTTGYALRPNYALNVLDTICTVYFTAELIIRFSFSPNKFTFCRNPMNIIDLLALVPLYMQFVLNSDAFQFCYGNERLIFEIMFILRIIRMFRIFHLVKHYQALQILVYALKASLQELLMLSIFLFIGMLIFATMIYYAERQNSGKPGEAFHTIPIGFWWAIITMTCVGYGDVVPTSPVGYVVGTACSVSGVLMLALTIPVISNNFTLFYMHVRSISGGAAPFLDEVDGNNERLYQSDDGAKIYENARRTSNGSIILNERRLTICRRPSNETILLDAISHDKAPAYNGDCHLRASKSPLIMSKSPLPRIKINKSVSGEVKSPDDKGDICITRTQSMNTHAGNGMMYSEK